jgi:hypothetical protein
MEANVRLSVTIEVKISELCATPVIRADMPRVIVMFMAGRAVSILGGRIMGGAGVFAACIHSVEVGEKT